MKNNKGITLVALIITIITMSILIGITVSSGGDLLQKSKMSDYIGYMKLVKARADVVLEDDWFEGDVLTGVSLSSSDAYYAQVSNVITKKGYDNTSKYEIKKWNGSIIASQGIDKSILGNDDEYFVVVFDKEKGETVDVLYSTGCAIDTNRYYSLNDCELAINSDSKVVSVKNLINNGDFSKDFESWSRNNSLGTAHKISTKYALFGSKSFEKPITSSVPYNYLTQVPTSGWIINHRYYVSLYAYNPSTTYSNVNFDIGNAGYGAGNTINVNSGWTKLSLIYPSDGVNRNIAVNYTNTAEVTYIDGVSIIDLTETFGAGKEPNKAWCDANLGYGVTEVVAPTN